jgi:hypothetical protein
LADWVGLFKGFDWTDGVTHKGDGVGAASQVLVLPKAGVYSVAFSNTWVDGAAQELTFEVLDALDCNVPVVDSAPVGQSSGLLTGISFLMLAVSVFGCWFL